MFERFMMPDVPRELWKLVKAKVGQHVWPGRSPERGLGFRVSLGPLYVEFFHDKPTKQVNVRILYGEE